MNHYLRVFYDLMMLPFSGNLFTEKNLLFQCATVWQRLCSQEHNVEMLTKQKE